MWLVLYFLYGGVSAMGCPEVTFPSLDLDAKSSDIHERRGSTTVDECRRVDRESRQVTAVNLPMGACLWTRRGRARGRDRKGEGRGSCWDWRGRAEPGRVLVVSCQCPSVRALELFIVPALEPALRSPSSLP